MSCLLLEKGQKLEQDQLLLRVELLLPRQTMMLFCIPCHSLPAYSRKLRYLTLMSLL